MELLTAKKKKALRNEGIIRGMMAVRTRVRFLDISERDAETVIKAIDADLVKMEAKPSDASEGT